MMSRRTPVFFMLLLMCVLQILGGLSTKDVNSVNNEIGVAIDKRGVETLKNMLKEVSPHADKLLTNILERFRRDGTTNSNEGGVKITEKQVREALRDVENNNETNNESSEAISEAVEQIRAKLSENEKSERGQERSGVTGRPKDPAVVSSGDQIKRVGVHIQGGESKSHTSSSESKGGSIAISENTFRDLLKALTTIAQSVFKTGLLQRLLGLPGRREKRFSEVVNRVRRQERSEVSGKDPAVVINNEAEKMIKRAIGGKSAHGPSGPGNVDTPRRRLVKRQKPPAYGDHIKGVGVHIQGGESKSHTSSSESNSGSIAISENTVRDLLKALTTIAKSVFKTDLLQRLLGLPGRPTRHKRFSEVVAKKQGTPNGLVINLVSTNKVTETVTSNTATISISHSALMEIMQLIPMLLEMLKGNMGPREKPQPSTMVPQPSTMVAGEMAEKPGCKDRSGQTPSIQDIQAVSGGRYKGDVGYYVFTKSNIYFLTKPDMCTNAEHVLISELTGDEYDKIPEVDAAFRVKDYVCLVIYKALPPPQNISKNISRTDLTTPTTPAATGDQESDDCQRNCTQEGYKVCGYNKGTGVFVLFKNECRMNVAACRENTAFFKVYMCNCQPSSEVDAYEVWVIKQTPSGSQKVSVAKSSCIFPMEDYVWRHITSITALNATTLLLIGDVKCKENHTCPETNTEGAFYKIQLGHNNAPEFIEFMDIHSEWNVDAFRFIEKDVSSGDMSRLIYNGGDSLGTLSADGLFVPHGRE